MSRASRRSLAALGLCLLIPLIVRAGSDTSTATNPQQEASELEMICKRSGADVNAQDLVSLALNNGEASLLLLSGDAQRAKDELGAELSIDVVVLDDILRHNPCHASAEALSKVGPMLRVIAAINQRHPIPAFQGNQRVLDVLQKAIADDPAHYQKLLERSKNWDHGIK